MLQPTTTFVELNSANGNRGLLALSQPRGSLHYYLTTGEIKTSTDENGRVTTFTYGDPGHLDRLTDVARSDNAHITSRYDDTGLTVTESAPIQGTDISQKITALDGLGRPLTTTIEDAANTVYSVVQAQYDPLGRLYKMSNPYTSSPQFWTTNQFDALGRPTLVTLPDGAQTTSSYNTDSVTLADPAGKQRRSFTNGLGQITEVDEPGNASAGAQAQGSITIGGSLGNKPGIPGASGSGSFTIKGNEGSNTSCFGRPIPTCHTTYDTGSVQVVVNLPGNTITETANYGQLATAQSLATNLMNQFSATGSFTNLNITNTTGSDGIPAYTVNMTASAVGSITNYSYSATQSGAHNDFTATTVGPAFTGGVDGQNAATDFGTITLTVGNFTTAPVCYGSSCNSTASAVAGALGSVLGVSGSPVGNIQVNGSTISMTANQASASWNVVVTATPASGDPGDFPQGSFASQGSLNGGADPYPSSLTHPYITSYSYDVLDNLLQVTQGVQTRSYGYDDMGRLTSVTTPEAAAKFTYKYNSFDLVTQRTDARGVNTNYDYDGLNRLKTISYDVGSTGVPATASVTYTYGTDSTANNNGRLFTMTDGFGSETYSYDQLGRMSSLQRVVNGTTYAISYAYNAAGEPTQITYPSGRVVQQSFDAIGRLCEIAPQTAACAKAASPYATAYQYDVAFQTNGFNYGNGVNATFGYSSDRMQLTSLSYVKGTQTLFGLSYFYHQDSANCPNAATGNNGQLQCITDMVDSGRNTAYNYDTLGRVASAATAGSANYPSWGLSFTFDRYGNRTAQNLTTGSAFSVSTPADPNTNHIIGPYSYDANGNMTNDGNNTLTYDAENRTASSTQGGTSATYSYDGRGLRVIKSYGGTTTVYIFSGSKVIAEYENGAAPSSPTREYIYSGSGLLAKIEGGTTNYYHGDHLSTRLTTDVSGSAVGNQGIYPYGDLWYDVGTTSKKKLGDYERDVESGNDYALARYYVNRIGRFASPDPIAGSITSPQGLNRYNYVSNDPINARDPSGTFIVGLDRFVGDPAGFGSNIPFGGFWDDLTFMSNMVRIGTAYLWQANSDNFHWQDFNHNELMGFYQDHEIGLIGTYGIYGYAFVDPPNTNKIKNQARNRINGKCLEFILAALKAAFNASNDNAASRGNPVNGDRLQAQKDVISKEAFVNAMMSSGVVVSNTPNKDIPTADAATSGNTITLYPSFRSDSDKAEVFIHETFHLDAPYGFDDKAMAQAVGARYNVVPGDENKTISNASKAWDKKLEKACGEQQKK